MDLAVEADRLDVVVQELISAYAEYATIWGAERQQKAQTAAQSFRTVSERDAYVLSTTVQISVQLMEIAQDIKAYEAERDHLTFVLSRSDFKYT